MITPYPRSYDPGYRSVNMTVASQLPTPYSATLRENLIDVGASTPGYGAPPVRTGTAVEAVMPHDLWYYRIHLLPAQLALGNLSGDVQREVVLWNANFSPVQLEAAQVAGDPGVTLTSAFVVPGALAPLQYEAFTVAVSGSGQPQVDATITWTIDGVDYVVPIMGRRSVVLPFKPEWSNDVTETLQWRTSLTTAYNGVEQVKSLRRPRRVFEYSVRLLDKDEAALFDQLMFGWTARMFSVPIWNEGSKTTADAMAGATVLSVDTRFMSLAVGANVALYRSAFDYEMVQVDAFTDTSITLRTPVLSNWFAGSRVYPMMTGALDPSVSSNRYTDYYSESRLRITMSPVGAVLRLDSTPSAETYQGFEIYTRYDTNWAGGMNVSNQAREKRLDNDLGPIRIAPKADFPLRIRAFSWLVRSRDVDNDLRAFFARREGRLRPVWMSSGTADLTLVEPTIVGDNQLKVRKNQYGSLINQHPAMRHLVLVLRDGRRLPYRIEGVSEDAAYTGLQLSQDFTEVISPAQVKRVSFLGLYRLGADEVAFERSTDTVSQVSVNFVLKVPPQ
jgi:hypothetical protein